MSKVSLRIIALVVTLLSVFGFALNTMAQDQVDIAVLLPDSQSSARWEGDDRRFLAAAFDAAGVSYSIVNAEGDRQTQITQAEQAITNGAKVLLMVNLDSGSGAAIIASAREAGAAVIDYDRLTIEGDGADFYVSFDNESVGRLQGEGLGCRRGSRSGSRNDWRSAERRHPQRFAHRQQRDSVRQWLSLGDRPAVRIGRAGIWLPSRTYRIGTTSRRC